MAEAKTKRPTVKVGDFEFQQYVPNGRKPPKTVRGVLVNTRDVLKDEGHWVQGEWFDNHNPDLDPEDAFCNSWQACLDGILQMVTVGAWRDTTYHSSIHKRWQIGELSYEPYSTTPNYDLYVETVRHINSLLPKSKYESSKWNPDLNDYEVTIVDGDQYGSIPAFNDSDYTKRTDVIALINKAIRTAPKGR